MSLAALVAGSLPSAVLEGDDSTPVPAIAFDSRKVTPGGLFVALRGGYVDGHDFLHEALKRGAVAALVEPETPHEKVHGFEAVLRAHNTRAALAPLAAEFYGHPSGQLNLVGVTGTDGKTTTCLYIRQILEQLGHESGLISTVSVQIPGRPDRSSERQTTPESLDVQRTLAEIAATGARTAILETTSHALETHRVDACDFDIGVVTNVTREHLDFHGSIENYRAAKGSLLRRVAQATSKGKRGCVVLNADDPGACQIASFAEGASIVWYSAAADLRASIQAIDITTAPDCSRFTLVVDGASFAVKFPLPGSWNVSNCLAAVGATRALGFDADAIAATLSNLKAVPGRLQRVDMGQDFTILVDYAHTPESLRAVLTEARAISRGRVLVTFGSAGERDIEKRAIQGAVAVELADYSIFTSEDPRFEDPERIIADIEAGAIERGAIPGVDFECIEDRERAVHELLSKARSGDVVILAGKGHEQSMIYGAENRPWDEATVARRALRKLGFDGFKDEGTIA
jgi:UDP-N-acetylmuramoyl-L-alanyl-D-glutamate--2,6-diaminopimelate ligase